AIPTRIVFLSLQFAASRVLRKIEDGESIMDDRYPRSSNYFPAAARSASTTACSCRILPPGIDVSPSRRRASALTLSFPVTNHKMFRERLSIGYVKVIRRRF